ncbi:unnamed protein product [Bursaphelenchus okinawaensis]|uniref:Probable arginine--tRNA ligase, mitochondrial n=1 Tax=Bursaphelenchus okinawaensis TaxID=465554 RepID=A0A811KAH8_9BILA|nr:unnamed protein product [Bursaphelenchus okinawaensis]CAG9097473.1 unnamed protein product [Bursaphelenchus okinawaensis]
MLLYLRRLQNKSCIFREIFESKNVVNKKIVVDFSSPNIAKQFHVGNLRSTLVGNFFCKINVLAGNQVASVNYLGDWGTQFGLLASYWSHSELYEKYHQIESTASLSIKLRLIQKAYVEAVARAKQEPEFYNEATSLLKSMETALISNDSSAESLKLWTEIRKVSVDYLEEFYKGLGIKFDSWDCESDHVAAASKLVDDLIAEGKVKQTPDGIWIIRDENVGGYSVLRKSDNTTLYLSREVACAINRDKIHEADEYVYVVDRAQARHFQHLKHILGLMNRSDLADKILHLGFGRVIGMSTRLGKVETTEQILIDGDRQAEKFIRKSATMKVSDEEIPAVARELAETALFINDMKRNKNQEYMFYFKDLFKQKGLFAIQEKYARITSLIENNQDLILELERAKNSETDWSRIQIDPEQSIRQLCQCLYELDASLYTSFLSSETSPLLSYMARLASRIGTAMHTARVKDEPDKKLALGRLMVFVASRNVLEEGIELLGLKPLNRL